MKFYDEDKSGKLRLQLEKEIMDWSDISTKKMFGCPCYMVNRKIFVFLVTSGVVIIRLSEEEKKELQQITPTEYFHTDTRTIKKWTKVPIDSEDDLNQLFPFIKMSYTSVMND
jgi:hypothetical protein